MPLFKRLLTPTDLPPENFDRETLSLDVKGKDLRRYKQEDLAEQIAAFANALGGSIIIGANEQAGGTYLYGPATEADADATRIRYEQANRDFCSPNPLLEAVVIPRPPGFVTVVNVWPFLGQAVGVRMGAPDKPTWLFPFRVGTQTKFLRAEQLPMIMLPELRKAAILLSQISEGEGVMIQNPGGGSNVQMLFKSIQIESATFTMQTNRGMQGPNEVATFPLEAILMIWKHHRDGWQIAVRGQILSEGTYQPPTQLRSY